MGWELQERAARQGRGRWWLARTLKPTKKPLEDFWDKGQLHSQAQTSGRYRVTFVTKGQSTSASWEATERDSALEFKNKHKIFSATIASCTTNASGGSPRKCHAKGCNSKRRQPKHPAPRFGWCSFSRTHPSPQGPGPVGGLCLQTGRQAAGGAISRQSQPRRERPSPVPRKQPDTS